MPTLSPTQVTLSSCLLAFAFATTAAAQQTEFLGSAAGSVAFIYDGGTEPCTDSPPGTTLLPVAGELLFLQATRHVTLSYERGCQGKKLPRGRIPRMFSDIQP